MEWEEKIKDLEFLLRKEKIESKTKLKEVFYEILEVHDGLERLLQIAMKQQWTEKAKTFVKERFSLVTRNCCKCWKEQE